jgi:hypothetical protein
MCKEKTLIKYQMVLETFVIYLLFCSELHEVSQSYRHIRGVTNLGYYDVGRFHTF